SQQTPKHSRLRPFAVDLGPAEEGGDYLAGEAHSIIWSDRIALAQAESVHLGDTVGVEHHEVGVVSLGYPTLVRQPGQSGRGGRQPASEPVERMAATPRLVPRRQQTQLDRGDS